ncbi:MAG TPA: cell division protein ZapD, partial [Gammaproteobacteria bacterium]|nr:cell division protein ZapD [Gammaproteobacteria bacterium]
MDDNITYEQPLSEIFRACLRLEYLFEQLDHQLKDSSYMGTRNIISVIINLLQLLDRPDLKTKLAKELSYQTTQLLRLENLPQTDQEKLHEVIAQLEELSRSFIDSSGKIGQNLRDIALLNNLRLHLMTPGGGLSFDFPIYNYWLSRSESERLETVQAWLNEFHHLRTAIHLLLRLVRESTPLQLKTATHGFYQELLDPQQNIRLIRVSINHQMDAYPEISVGRHFVSIR